MKLARTKPRADLIVAWKLEKQVGLLYTYKNQSRKML